MGNSFICGPDGLMNSPKLLSAAIVASRVAQNSTLIFLHGLGDDGNGWCSALRDIVPDYCKLICPHAPTMPVALNMNMQMPAWYNIYALSPDAQQDEAGITGAAQECTCAFASFAFSVRRFVDSEVSNGIEPNRIVIGGFSQGGSVALYHALTNNQSLGGVVGLSCWLPMHVKLIADPTLITGCRQTPVFQCHGLDDCLVPFVMGQSTHELLKRFQFSQCEFKSYPNLGHSSSNEEIADMKCFLKKALPPI